MKQQIKELSTLQSAIFLHYNLSYHGPGCRTVVMSLDSTRLFLALLSYGPNFDNFINIDADLLF